jgi:E3 ubiquitin-protein ligase MYCBP2
LAECVGEARLLLRQILSESGRYQCAASRDGANRIDGQIFETLREQILDECHNTFIGCFHAFYPTANLKWICLCELLAPSDPVSGDMHALILLTSGSF